MIMTLFLSLALIAGGYIAAVFTWPKVKELINGAETEIHALEAKAKALRDKIKDVL